MMWLLLVGAIVTEVAATLSLRASDGFRRKVWLVPVCVGYLISFAFLSSSLAHGMPVGIAYGVWSACGVALVAVLGKFLFAEPLTWLMGLGIGFIIAGVVTIELIGAVR
jgi:small multidrug resistance pump